ncbi:MAG: hypothetical protein IPL99_04990 [Candidatus Competibacteraceae bacterium]|nr:hypothetical protein [Candidatus Competibacteraceae bacterium]
MKLNSMKLLTLSLLPAVFRRASFLAAVAILGSVAVNPAFAVSGAVATAGLAITSVVVGAAGVAGGGWKTRLLGYAVGLVDPDPATFYDGTIVMTYPEDLLTFTGVGWFGNFAEDPNLPVPPIVSTPFFDFDSATPPGNFLQSPNPALTVSTSATGGVVTIKFDANPSGVTVDPGTHFNLLSIVFQNTSGQELQWQVVPAQAGPVQAALSDSANFFSNPDLQVLTCRPPSPDPNSVPVQCGDTEPANRYQVFAVPEPETLWLFATSFVGLLGYRSGSGSRILRRV